MDLKASKVGADAVLAEKMIHPCVVSGAGYLLTLDQ